MDIFTQEIFGDVAVYVLLITAISFILWLADWATKQLDREGKLTEKIINKFF